MLTVVNYAGMLPVFLSYPSFISLNYHSVSFWVFNVENWKDFEIFRFSDNYFLPYREREKERVSDSV